MARLDKDKQAELEPKRMQYAIDRLKKAGYTAQEVNPTKIEFQYMGNTISLWPYSGWFSGKGIEQGRGINELIKQLKYIF